MALIEFNGIMRTMVNETPSIFYPATKKDNVIDLDEATESESGLMSPNHVKVVGALDKLSDDAVFVDEESSEGIPSSEPRDADTLGGKYTATDIDALVQRIAALESLIK